MPPSWPELRAQMLLDPEVVNLNTGSFGPLPRVVFDRVTELRRRLAEEPMDFLVRQAGPLLWEARQRLARYLGAEPRRLAFTANVTAALNMVASGLRLASPGEILLTDHEYGSMHWCWERAARRQGLTLRTIPLPRMPRLPEEIVAAARAALSPRTRILCFSHVLSPTGMVLPARDLCDLARRHGVLTVIDGAHAPALVPLDLEAIQADFYAGNCHKWLLAPTGSGFLHFGKEARHLILPDRVSWGWHYERGTADEPEEFGATPFLRSFEFEGTRDPCPWLTVPAAIEFQEKIGLGAIRERIAELVRHVRHRLDGLLEPATPEPPELHAAMTAYRLPAGTDPRRLRHDLWTRHRIEAPVFERPDGLLLRVSTHFYNTENEIDRLAAALRELI